MSEFITRADVQYVQGKGWCNKQSGDCWLGQGFSAIIKKTQGEAWKQNMDAKALRQATERGIGFDNCIQAYFEQNACHLECKDLLTSAEPVLGLFEMKAQEVFAYSQICYQPIVGFIDAIVSIDTLPKAGQLLSTRGGTCSATTGTTIVDFKTKATPKFNPQLIDKYAMQLALYNRLIRQFYGIEAEQACIVFVFADASPAQLVFFNQQKLNQIFSQIVRPMIQQIAAA